MRGRFSLPRALLLAVIAGTLPVSAQTYFDDIGWTDLFNLLGETIPDGSGVIASTVEADESGDSGLQYKIDVLDPQFAGKSFTFETTGGFVSFHATLIAQVFFGNSSSMAPGITTVRNREASDWLTNSLHLFDSLPTAGPEAVTADVQNHSWIGNFGNATLDQEAVRRFDASIFNSDYVAVVGLNNGAGAVPALLAHSYNAIAVGRSDGSHSYGLTTNDGAGRSKPDIVAPKSSTSEATAAVSSAAAVLIESAGGSSARGAHAVVVKAILMAGATRQNETEFAWTPNRDNGVNNVTGAGELNILRSYEIMASGEKSPGTDLGDSGAIGWAYESASSASGDTYFFSIPDGGFYDYGIALTWMRVVQSGTLISGGWNNPTSSLADLDLSFYSADGTVLGSLIANGFDDSRDLSVTGDVSNVELLAFSYLAPGDYAIRVTSAAADPANYGLAWGGTAGAIPEPSTIFLTLAAIAAATLLAARTNPAARRKTP